MRPILARNLYPEMLRNIKYSLKWLDLIGQMGGVMPITLQIKNKQLLLILKKLNRLRVILMFLYAESIILYSLILKNQDTGPLNKITSGVVFTVITTGTYLGFLNGAVGFTNKYFWRVAASDISFYMNNIKINKKYFKTSNIKNFFLAIFVMVSPITTTLLMFIGLDFDTSVSTAIFIIVATKSYIKLFFADFVNQIQRRFSEINDVIRSMHASRKTSKLACYGKYF